MYLFLFFIFIHMANATNLTIDQFSGEYAQESKKYFPATDCKYENNNQFINVYNDKIISKVKDFYKIKLDFLQKNYNINSLNADDLITYKILKQSLENNLKSFDYKIGRLLPLNQIFSMHLDFPVLGSGSSYHIFKTANDYQNWALKMKTFAESLYDAINLMQEGIDKKIVLQKSLIEKIIPQFQTIINIPIEENPFYSSVLLLQNNKEISNQDKENIIKQYKDIVTEEIIPAYKKVLEFLKHKYLPNAGKDTGIGQYENGDQYYQFVIKFFAESDLNPDKIHDMGLQEVNKIAEQIKEIQKEMNFEGTLHDFLQSIKTDPKVTHFNTEQEVLDYLNNISKTVNKNVHKLFTVFPKTPLVIKPIEKFRAESSSAMYMPGDLEKGLPGIFYIPIINPQDIGDNKGLEATFVHEATPGHHYQLSLQQENPKIGKFRKEIWFAAMGEGWALYTESLGLELGCYVNKFEYLGYLNMSMLRAIRLVVDTGLHAKGWTRQQAIDYSKQYLVDSDQEIIAAIERYMAVPGQALAYKIGYFKIIEMKEKYQKLLGKKFDIREFHDILLVNGSVPLYVWHDIMEEWANKKLAE